MKIPKNKELLSITDMAKILNVHKSLVGARARKRKVGIIIGHSRIFKQSDIEKMKPGKSGNFRKDN